MNVQIYQYKKTTHFNNLQCKHPQKNPTDTHKKKIKSAHQSTGSPASFRQEMSALWHAVQQKKMTAISRHDLKLKPIVNLSSCKMKTALSKKGKFCIFSVLIE